MFGGLMKSDRSRQAAPSADRFSGGLPVPAIHIDLRDGFDHDDVVLHVNNREAARVSDVTTNLTVSCCLVRRPQARRAMRTLAWCLMREVRVR